MTRHFFALWPEAVAARALAELSSGIAAATGGRPVDEDRIHLTLAFLGDVPDERLDFAREAAARIRAAAFDVVLDRVGAFRRAGVAWAGISQAHVEMLGFQSRLAGALEAHGFTLEARPFHAHVTLARKIAKSPAGMAMAPVGWRAREFALVRSEPGSGRYSTLERWGLE